MIDTQAIRNKILDLAMKGQLTEQLPEDGTAEELYQRIQVEKQMLIRSKKIRKDKLGASITDNEIPFTIPENWKWVRLRDLGVFSGGKTPSMRHKGYWENGVVPWITSKDMKQKYIASSEMLISEIAAREMAIHPKKTVLFVVRSGILRRMFPVAILTESGTINQDLKALELYVPDMCEYVYYVLKRFESTILFKYAKDGTTVNNIVFDALLTMPIPLPPLAEQQHIIGKIDQAFSVLDTIDALQAQYADNLTVLKAKLIDAAIQGKLTEQLPEDGTAEELYQQIQTEKQALIKAGKIKKEKPLPEIKEDEIPFEIPMNWKWVRVGTIGSWGAGATPSRNNPDYYAHGTIPWLKTGDLNDDYITAVPEKITQQALEETSVRLNPIGSVLMAMYGATIGKLGILLTPMTTNQACCACIPFKGIYNRYLFYYLLSARTSYINKGKGGAQPNISKEIIVGSLMPLPPFSEQKRIVSKLDDWLSVITK